ncbi:MAG: septum site-determining protein MinC [Chloroflexi bacterium]|nr:septum site-determining protein MinC [Chloroflexota bacterium]
MSIPLSMKGIGDGLLVTVPEGTWSVVRPSLLQAIDERSDFFRGAYVALQMANRSLNAAALGGLRDELSEREIVLTAILTTSKQTRVAGADLGLALEIPRPNIDQDFELDPIESDLEGDEAVLLHRTLRSGHSIRHPGHVVVIGDVNPGAEVVAGGNVVVWGRVRGVVHAGATGNTKAVVCALDLAPTQLRIAAQISISPERKGKPRPEMAMLKNGQFVAEGWEHN